MTGPKTAAEPLPHAARRQRHSRLFMIGVPVVSLLAVFALAEAGLRLFVRNSLSAGRKPGEIQLVTQLPGSKRFYGLTPGLGPPENTNSLGLRGEETSWAKPAGTLRVLMLGDSITYGNGVAWNETFSYRLQQILNGAGAAARVEVLNLGVSGYNTAQELATLQELGLRLDPDLVILNICLNDSDPVKQLLGLSLLNKTRISSWRDINLRTVIESSYLLTLLKHRVIALLQNFDGLLSTLNSPSLFLDTRVRETAWADMKADMRAMHELTRQEGIPFAAVIYPYMSQIVAGSDRVPQQDLLAFFDELGVPALDPAPVFESARQDMYNDAYIHLSAYGHQQVAAALADFIRERRLLRGPGAG